MKPTGRDRATATGGNDAMDMGVGCEFLTPGVQNAEEADLRTEMAGIASDFEKCFRTGAKQEIVEDLSVLQGQWSQPLGKGEDHMDVARRENSRRRAAIHRSRAAV